MFETSDSMLGRAQGGANPLNWFKPMKFIAKQGTGQIKDVPFTTGGGGVVNIPVEGKMVVDRALQAKRIGLTTVGVGLPVAGGLYLGLKPGQSGEAQAPSIEQLTGLE
jgi:hypothetical protein